MTQQLDLFPTALQLCRIDPEQNMQRFYRLSLQPDLFGGCSLIREWAVWDPGAGCAGMGLTAKDRP